MGYWDRHLRRSKKKQEGWTLEKAVNAFLIFVFVLICIMIVLYAVGGFYFIQWLAKLMERA